MDFRADMQEFCRKSPTTVASGGSAFSHTPSRDGILILNYDVLPPKKGRSTSEWVDFLLSLAPKVMVMDESHYIKNPKAKRTKMALELCKRIPKKIFLSGTPIENKTMDFWTTLSVLDPKNFGNYFKFGMEYCNGYKSMWGYDFSGSSNQDTLLAKASRVMIRRKKCDVLKELPPQQNIVIPVDISNRSEYNWAEADFIQWVRENKGSIAAMRARRSEAITRIAYLKTLAARGKLDAIRQWIDNYREETGKKLVVCASHHEILDELTAGRKKYVRVDGSKSAAARQAAVDQFQSNPDIAEFYGQIKAMGVGMTLTAADTVLFTELEWNPSIHDQAAARVHRIGQTSSNITAYYLIAVGTLEESIAEAIDAKRQNIARVLDGEDLGKHSLLATILRWMSGHRTGRA